jgi:phosphoribosyl 1,2-cyclic phosphate phosphodiesterase
MIGCRCEVCTSDDPRDRRDRPGAMITHTDPHGRIRHALIDTTPELRQQMIRHDIHHIDGVAYTHFHADHIFGIDDLRRFNAVMEAPIDIHADRKTLDALHRTFNYIFEPHKNVNKSFVPTLIPNEIQAGVAFDLAGLNWQPIELMHGRLPILGFRVGNLAYCTDCSRIPPGSYEYLTHLDVLVIDALRYRHHPTHMTIDQALAVIDELQPRRAVFTHLAHDVKHADLEKELPSGVEAGYDGMVVEVR